MNTINVMDFKRIWMIVNSIWHGKHIAIVLSNGIFLPFLRIPTIRIYFSPFPLVVD